MKMENIEEITDFRTSRERQSLVRGQVTWVQAIAELRVGLNWKEPKRGVVTPIQTESVRLMPDFCAVQKGLSQQPVDRVPMSEKD